MRALSVADHTLVHEVNFQAPEVALELGAIGPAVADVGPTAVRVEPQGQVPLIRLHGGHRPARAGGRRRRRQPRHGEAYRQA